MRKKLQIRKWFEAPQGESTWQNTKTVKASRYVPTMRKIVRKFVDSLWRNLCMDVKTANPPNSHAKTRSYSRANHVNVNMPRTRVSHNKKEQNNHLPTIQHFLIASFHHLGDLKHHEKAVHQRLRPFKCSLCPHSAGAWRWRVARMMYAIFDLFAFWDVSPLIRFLGSKGDLNRHVVLRHKYKGIKPFQCSYCLHSSAQLSNCQASRIVLNWFDRCIESKKILVSVNDLEVWVNVLAWNNVYADWLALQMEIGSHSFPRFYM